MQGAQGIQNCCNIFKIKQFYLMMAFSLQITILKFTQRLSNYNRKCIQKALALSRCGNITFT
jgi:hypothetical protein